MYLDAYLKFEGPEIVGESADSQFKDQIRILSADLRAARGEYLMTAKGEAMSTVAPKFEPIRILKQLDKSTPMLLKGFTQNTGYKSATLSFCLPDPTPRSTTKIVYLQITLETVQIVRYVFVGNPAAFRTREGATLFTDNDLTSIGPVDEFELACRKMDVLYKGTDGKANISHAFDSAATK